MPARISPSNSEGAMRQIMAPSLRYRLTRPASGEMLLDLPFQGGLGHRADDRVDMLAVLEEQDAGDGPHVEPHGRARIGVDVDLGHLGLAGVLAAQLIEDRRHDL